MTWLLVPLLPLALVLLMRRAAIRFAARQRRAGRWDDKGPLVETEPPPHTIEGGNMSEILEAKGLWHGRVISDRRGELDGKDDRERRVR